MRLWPADVLPAWLNPMQAVAWIVTRNPDVVELAAEPRPNLTADAAAVWDLPRDGVSLLWLNLYVGSERAEAELESLAQAARDGIVTATGLRASDRTRHPLGADWWHDHVLAECRREGTDEALSLCRSRPGRLMPDAEWTRILLSSGSVLARWPAPAGRVVSNAHTHGLHDSGDHGQATKHLARIIDATEAVGMGQAVSDVARLAVPEASAKSANLPASSPRPKPTRSAVIAWMRERVENWPDHLSAPSENTDWKAASLHFGNGLRRDKDFRPIRADETPLEWQKQGRRRPWGAVKKSAGNSAKLRPQN